MRETLDEIRIKVTYTLDEKRIIIEDYRITRSGIEYEVRVQDAETILVQVPLLKTDGINKAEFKLSEDYFKIYFLNHFYEVKVIEPDSSVTQLEQFEAPNRNAIYKVGCFEAPGNRMKVLLSIKKVK